MQRAKIVRWVAGAALAGAGLFAQANVGAKSLHGYTSPLPSPAPTCMANGAQGVGYGYRLSGGNWIFNCGVEATAGAGTNTTTSCSSSNSGIAISLIGWNSSGNTTTATTGIVTPWTQGASVTLTCTDGKSASSAAWGT